ncbi:MAG TPA: ATP-dependent Clp protease adaptor ClpS [Pseudonocardiaceae bacterium]
MAEAAGWQVDVCDDDVNTMHAVAYLLHRVCGMSLQDALRTMTTTHEQGSAEIGRFDSQDEAEQLAARLQTYGLHAVVRGNR